MRRAQAFTIDLIIAVIILVIGSVVLYQSFSLDTVDTNVRLDSLTIASGVFEPFPADWNSTSVVIPGFVVDHRLNVALLTDYVALGYDELATLHGVNSRFWVMVGESGGMLAFVGELPQPQAENVHSTTRYAAHDGEIVRIQVGAWQ